MDDSTFFKSLALQTNEPLGHMFWYREPEIVFHIAQVLDRSENLLGTYRRPYSLYFERNLFLKGQKVLHIASLECLSSVWNIKSVWSAFYDPKSFLKVPGDIPDIFRILRMISKHVRHARLKSIIERNKSSVLQFLGLWKERNVIWSILGLVLWKWCFSAKNGQNLRKFVA